MVHNSMLFEHLFTITIHMALPTNAYVSISKRHRYVIYWNIFLLGLYMVSFIS